jgi:hypothetical protein
MAETPLFEIRTYTASEGKMDALLARFRDHTVELFASHNMANFGYWVPVDQPDTLIYILKHEGDPASNWAAMAADQTWIDAKAASEVDGVLTAHIESVYMTATDFSSVS